jgi:hypothetical protein
MMPELAITFLTPERFQAKPQIGLTISQEWHSLLRCLTWPSYGDDKRCHGAWCPTALEGGKVKGGRGPVSLLVADVDNCRPGAIDYSAEALAPYAGCVVPTFSATPERPKHRIVLLPSRSLTPDEFPLAWTKMAATLATGGIAVDRGCKNINRLYYACVARSPEAWLGARILTGSPVDVDAMLGAAKIDREREAARVTQKAQPCKPVDAGTAIARAVTAVRNASAGERHDTLLRRAYSLKLDGVDEQKIVSELLPAFVSAAGEAREREGERAIRDAISAAEGAA